MKARLTAKEEEIMQIVWATGDLFIRDIVARMPEPKPSYNTVATQVKFLEEKGFLTRKPMANSFCYSPAISEKEYRGSTVGDLVARYYDNSYSLLVSQFVEDEKMDLYGQLQQILADEAASVFIEDPADFVALNANFTGYVSYPLSAIDLTTIKAAK